MDHQPFDTAAKELIWEDPAAWLARFGIGPPGLVQIIESEATTLAATADKVIKVLSNPPYLVNIELQSSHETNLVRTMWMRQTLLDYRHDLPVLTVLVLLRKEANSPRLSGEYVRKLPDGTLTNRYAYKVVRLWREKPEAFLEAGPALAPLAPLAAVTEAELPDLVRRMAERINREPPLRASKLWTATFLLMGLRYPDTLTVRLLEGVASMRESTTYQWILKEGREEGIKQGIQEGRQEGRQEGLQEGLHEGRVTEARRLLLHLGVRRIGNPPPKAKAAVDRIDQIERLELLIDRIHDAEVTSWNQLLKTP